MYWICQDFDETFGKDSNPELERLRKIRNFLEHKYTIVTWFYTDKKPLKQHAEALYISENELLQLALDLEAKSEHPLSKAIINFALEKNLIPQSVKEFVAVSGNGLQAKNKNDELIFAGKLDFVQQTVQVPAEMIKLSEDYHFRERLCFSLVCKINSME